MSQVLNKYMGLYRPSYLQYLTGDYSTASMAFNMDTQEKRKSYVTSLVKEILPNLSAIAPPPYDSSLLHAMSRIRNEMMPFAVTVVQSVWRMHICRSSFLAKLKATRLIQDFWRRYWYLVKAAKKELELLKLEKKVGKAFVTIQSFWRGFKARREAAALRLQKEKEEDFKIKFRKPVSEIDDLDGVNDNANGEEALDDWLSNVKTNEFDDEMDDYLGSEELLHYKFDKSKNPNATHVVSSKSRGTTGREALTHIANRVSITI